ncbi:MAG: response regulator transcription factor [Flavisolibacter sp.]
MKSGNTIRLITANANRIFLRGLSTIFKAQEGFELIAETTNGKQLYGLVEKYSPDVVITGVLMPDLTGIEACKMIKSNFMETEIIGYSLFDNHDFMIDMIRAGAKSYLFKSSTEDEILRAVREVYKGKEYFPCMKDTQIMGMVFKRSQNHLKKTIFTFREIEIIKLLCMELTTREIAINLKISERTVEDHRKNIQKKCGAKNLAGIVLYAIKSRIVIIPTSDITSNSVSN